MPDHRHPARHRGHRSHPRAAGRRLVRSLGPDLRHGRGQGPPPQCPAVQPPPAPAGNGGRPGDPRPDRPRRTARHRQDDARRRPRGPGGAGARRRAAPVRGHQSPRLPEPAARREPAQRRPPLRADDPGPRSARLPDRRPDRRGRVAGGQSRRGVARDEPGRRPSLHRRRAGGRRSRGDRLAERRVRRHHQLPGRGGSGLPVARRPDRGDRPAEPRGGRGDPRRHAGRARGGAPQPAAPSTTWRRRAWRPDWTPARSASWSSGRRGPDATWPSLRSG